MIRETLECFSKQSRPGAGRWICFLRYKLLSDAAVILLRQRKFSIFDLEGILKDTTTLVVPQHLPTPSPLTDFLPPKTS